MTHRLTIAAFAFLAMPAFAQIKVTYDQHVLPVLREKCLNCHNADKARGGLDASSFSKLMEGGSSGAVVKPGDADASRFYRLTAHLEQPVMPPNAAPIAKASIDIIKNWIDQGAPENAGSKVMVAAKPKLDLAVKAGPGKPAGPPPLPQVTLPQDLIRTAKPDAITALAASPWAQLLAVGANQQILIYNTDSLEFIGKLAFPPGRPNVLKFSRNGAILIAGGGRAGKSGKVVGYDVKTAKQLFEIGDELDSVLAADITPDQSEIAFGGPGKLIRVYSTADGSKVRDMKKHTDWVTAIEYSPDGVLLATGDRAGNLLIWEANTGREFHNLRGHKGGVTDLSWRGDSNLLASACEDGKIRLWEQENGNAVKTWDAHGGGALAVKFAHDGRIVSTGRDRITKLWNGEGEQQRPFEALPDLGLRVAVDSEMRMVFAGDLSGQLAVWESQHGKRLGTLTTNPQPLRERLEIAKAEFNQRQAAHDAVSQELNAAKVELVKLTGELDSVRKSLVEAEANVKAMAGAVGPAEQALQQANTKARELRNRHKADDVTASAIAEAAAKVKSAADAARDNPALAAAAEKTRLLAERAAGEREAVAKQLREADQLVQVAAEKVAATKQAVAAGDAAVKAAREAVPVKEQTVKTAAERMKVIEAKVASAAAARDAAKALIEKLDSAAKPSS